MSQGLFDAFLEMIDDLTNDAPLPPQSTESAKALVRAYRDDGSAGIAWNGFTKAAWCARIEALLVDPRKLDQRPTFYCMPAACLFVLFRRVPNVMATFCIDLARTGAGRIGDERISMTQAIRDFDVASYAREKQAPINPVDLVLFLAMQEQMSLTDLDAPDDYAAAPGLSASNISDMLSATKLFDVTLKSRPKAADLAAIDASTEVVLFGGMDLFSALSTPKHAAVLVPPFVEAAGQSTIRFWSWGLFEGNNTLPLEGGAYVRRMSTASFELKIDSAIFAKLKP